MSEIRPDRFGDKDKRICKYYTLCYDLKEEWEDERGCQLFCVICNASAWVPISEYGEYFGL